MPEPIAASGTTLTVTVVVLLAAVLHAVWNALAKQLDDQLAGFVLFDLTGVVVAATAAAVVPMPRAPSWPFLAASAVLHIGYKAFLMSSYRVGDLNQVYPLARGTGPLLVAVFAATVVGERLGPPQLAGVLLVCAGLMSLGLGPRRAGAGQRLAVGFALATGVFIAAYTVADGLGVRRSGSALGYIVWLAFVGGLPIPLYGLLARYRALARPLRRQWRAGVAVGVLSLIAYGLVIWAQTRGALAAVAALRETSVIVAALLGTLLFGERFGPVRVLASVLVAAGAVLLNLPG
jgi:drug/metabolite transporter (DMT)-like permease